MADIVLGGISLPGDMQWIDEYGDGADLVAHDQRTTITGALVIQASAQQAGRLVTLQGRLDGNKGFAPLTKSQLDAVAALATVPGAVYELVLEDGRMFDVMFRRPSINADPWRHVVPHENDDLFFVTINLIQV